jgi:hypothetical protein
MLVFLRLLPLLNLPFLNSQLQSINIQRLATTINLFLALLKLKYTRISYLLLPLISNITQHRSDIIQLRSSLILILIHTHMLQRKSVKLFTPNLETLPQHLSQNRYLHPIL